MAFNSVVDAGVSQVLQCVVLAEQWNTLLFTSTTLTNKEASVTGFRNFLMTHHFQWYYPCNAVILGWRFKVCETYASGWRLWKWARKIAALKNRLYGQSGLLLTTRKS
jgi:hypothetical protein